jgi:hypothetical protein
MCQPESANFIGIGQTMVAPCGNSSYIPGMPNEDKALRKAIERAGGKPALALALGVTRQTIQKWRKVPVLRALEVERLTGVSRHDLRPDVYPQEG